MTTPAGLTYDERGFSAIVQQVNLGMSHFKPKLILASTSPQRRLLLHEAGYEFELVEPSPQAECGICSRETPPDLVARLALQKAADVVQRVQGVQGRIVIGCDTVAECVGQILGKPRDAAHARQMLALLSGREHHVYSGLCLWRPPAEPLVRVAATTLRMDVLPAAEIEEYIHSGLWQGKAGAFGYQDRAGWLHIEFGSESNVIGLPLELLADMLTELERAKAN